MPDDSRSAALYPVPPRPDDERIVLAIQRSRPEEIPGLVWTQPDFAVTDHRIVRKFDIDGKKRPDRAFIPCAMCSGGHPKFLAGSILWSPDGHLRLIGHVCAAKDENFGEARYRQLVKQREQEELDNATLAWMETNIASIGLVASSVAELGGIVRFWEEQQGVFFRGVPQLAEVLENIARRQDGVLTVVQESSSAQLVAAAMSGPTARSRATSSQYGVVTIGTLSGLSFLRRPSTKRSRQLEGMLEAFASMPEGNPQQQLLTLFGGGEHAVTTTTGLVFRNMQRAVKLADECADALQFMTPENTTLIESWGGDERNPQPFTIRRYSSALEFLLPDRSRARLQTAWPSMPDLSALRRIVAAGIELDDLLKRNKM